MFPSLEEESHGLKAEQNIVVKLGGRNREDIPESRGCEYCAWHGSISWLICTVGGCLSPVLVVTSVRVRGLRWMLESGDWKTEMGRKADVEYLGLAPSVRSHSGSCIEGDVSALGLGSTETTESYKLLSLSGDRPSRRPCEALS
jgi:hypothetical protein